MPSRRTAALTAALALTSVLAGCLGGQEEVDLNNVDGLSLSVTPESGSVDTAFTFDASGTPGAHALTFTWDFGDGATETGETVTHTFAYDNNRYRVQVTATAGNQTLTDTIDVLVGSGENARPAVVVHPSATWVGHGDMLNVHASAEDPDGDPLTISWLLSKNMAEGGGHAHAPGEEHGPGGEDSGASGFGIPEPTGQTGETAEFTFTESGTYRVVARATDPKGGKTESHVDIKVTQTVPKTTFTFAKSEQVLIGDAGAGVSLVLYDLMQPNNNTNVDSARFDFRLLYTGTGIVSLTWNGSAAPADLDLRILDDAGEAVAEFATRDPLGTAEGGDVTLPAGSYALEVRAFTGAAVPYDLLLDLALEVPGLTDGGEGPDGHGHDH